MPSKGPLLTDLDRTGKTSSGLSRRAAQFFDQDIFKDISGIDEEENSGSDQALEDREEEAISADLDELDFIREKDQGSEGQSEEEDLTTENVAESEDSAEDDDGFEIVKRKDGEARWEDEEPRRDGRLGMQAHDRF